MERLAMHREAMANINLGLGPKDRRGADPQGRPAREYAASSDAPSSRHVVRSQMLFTSI
jgi:hypothetical protein